MRSVSKEFLKITFVNIFRQSKDFIASKLIKLKNLNQVKRHRFLWVLIEKFKTNLNVSDLKIMPLEALPRLSLSQLIPNSILFIIERK